MSGSKKYNFSRFHHENHPLFYDLLRDHFLHYLDIDKILLIRRVSKKFERSIKESIIPYPFNSSKYLSNFVDRPSVSHEGDDEAEQAFFQQHRIIVNTLRFRMYIYRDTHPSISGYFLGDLNPGHHNHGLSYAEFKFSDIKPMELYSLIELRRYRKIEYLSIDVDVGMNPENVVDYKAVSSLLDLCSISHLRLHGFRFDGRSLSGKKYCLKSLSLVVLGDMTVLRSEESIKRAMGFAKNIDLSPVLGFNIVIISPNPHLVEIVETDRRQINRVGESLSLNQNLTSFQFLSTKGRTGIRISTRKFESLLEKSTSISDLYSPVQISTSKELRNLSEFLALEVEGKPKKLRYLSIVKDLKEGEGGSIDINYIRELCNILRDIDERKKKEKRMFHLHLTVDAGNGSWVNNNQTTTILKTPKLLELNCELERTLRSCSQFISFSMEYRNFLGLGSLTNHLCGKIFKKYHRLKIPFVLRGWDKFQKYD